MNELSVKSEIAATQQTISFFEKLLRASAEGILITDSAQNIILANDAFSSIFGQKLGDVAETNLYLWLEQLDADASKKWEQLEKEVRRKGECRDMEFHLEETDGVSYYSVNASFLEKVNNEDIGVVISIWHDITSRKLAEEDKEKLETKLNQAQKMEAIGTLAGGIAHDFNNIMGIILTNTELASSDVPEQHSVKRNLEDIRIASLRARDLIKQILTFSCRQEQEKIHLDMGPLLKGVLKMLRSSLPATIKIRQNIEPHIRTILADPTQLHQVMMHVSTSAFQAMEEGGGIMTVGLENIELNDDGARNYTDLSTGEYVSFSITDTGHGISHEIKENIFDPFYTTKETGKGSGMGLAVVHGIVKDHGGDITVQSEPGKGTRVQVVFPAVKNAAESEVESQERLLKGNERILFVDDEELLVSAAKKMLFGLGYKVVTETRPIAALELFKKQPNNFDLVVTDVTMPDMTGDRLAKEMTCIRPDIPVIFCTGYSERITEEKAKEIGVKAYVEKPYQSNDLAAAIRDVLDQTEEGKAGKIKSILVIGDEVQMRSALRQMLEHTGYNVMEAPDGNVARWIFKEKKADLIIADLIMHEKEGIETIMELKQDFPEVKIIAISGSVQGDSGQYFDIAKKIGADSILAKTFEREELIKEVKGLLG